MLPFSILPCVTVRMVPPLMTTSLWIAGVSGAGFLLGVAFSVAALALDSVPGVACSGLAGFCDAGEGCCVFWGCCATAKLLSTQHNDSSIARYRRGRCGIGLNSEGGNERTRDSMGANSNWQSAIRVCISSQKSNQHSALSIQPNKLERNGRKGRKEIGNLEFLLTW